MSGLAAWVLGLAWPVITRILVSAGIGLVSIVGIDAVLQQLLGVVKASMSGVTPSVAALLAIAKFPDAVGMVAGAMIASVALIATQRYMRLWT